MFIVYFYKKKSMMYKKNIDPTPVQDFCIGPCTLVTKFINDNLLINHILLIIIVKMLFTVQ